MKQATQHSRVVMASTIGNIMEWFDFISFGYLMGIISKHFFPSIGTASGLLLSTATFGVSFLARPLGAVLLGAYADRNGRRRGLFLVMLLMSVSTFLITFAPTYQMIGIGATVLIVIARVIQGISAGGEFGCGTAMLIEHAPKERKGLFGSFMLMSQAVAGTLAAVCGLLITQFLSPAQLDSWGWRLPFALGLLLAPIGLYIRRNVEESAEFKTAVRTEDSITFMQFLARYPKANLIGTGMSVGINIVQIFFNVYMPVYATKSLGLPAQAAFLAVALSGVARIITTPLFGMLADRWGRRNAMIYGCAANVIAVMPCLIWLHASPGFATLLTIELIISIFTQIVNAATPTALAELFPATVRSRGLSVTYNVAVTLFGGTAPFVITWLVAQTGNDLMPGYYATAGMIISLVCSCLIPSRTRFATDTTDAGERRATAPPAADDTRAQFRTRSY